MEAGEGLHLVDHVESVTRSLWNEMKDSLSAELEGILNKHKWPKVDPSLEMDEAWVSAIEKLVDLQVPEIMHAQGAASLLPFDIMAHIFVTEFRFHFLSDKRTSDPQVIGSHCFPWFISLIEKWEDFFRDNLSHLLAAEFYDTPMSANAIYVDPVCAFITAMLPVMREKVSNTVSKAVQSPSFLSSLISQLMTFDETLRTKFGYDGGDAQNGWAGLTTEVLDEHFDAWFQAEKDFAAERFRTIMTAPDAHNIDYNYTTDGRMKPTFAAVRVTDLLRSLTNQYNRVRKFKHKIRFLIGIQLDILDEYHDRLRGSLEAYQAATSTLGRTLHGVSKEQMAMLEGTGALETLCKVLGSSDHIVNNLKDWGNEDFFVLLWDELQSRAAKRSSGVSFTGTMTYDDVRGRTSSSVGAEEDGGLFDETISAYGMRRKAAQDLLVRALDGAHSKALRGYVNRVQWTTIGDSALLDDPSSLTISPELDQPLHIIRRNFEFLIKAVSTASYRRIWREALGKIQDQLWHDVLVRQTFSTFGAAQFARDVTAIFALVDRFIPHGSVAMDTLAEGVRLLNLPAEIGSPDDGGKAQLTLKEASDRVFTDNDEARAVLEVLQLQALTPANARLILQKRVENSENVGW
ncbi:hypothetical protein NLU13_7949 [Sarocladium strictum]|nr:hypothetical protein NLU13_7949 [Sarocladium strictum]